MALTLMGRQSSAETPYTYIVDFSDLTKSFSIIYSRVAVHPTTEARNRKYSAMLPMQHCFRVQNQQVLICDYGRYSHGPAVISRNIGYTYIVDFSDLTKSFSIIYSRVAVYPTTEARNCKDSAMLPMQHCFIVQYQQVLICDYGPYSHGPAAISQNIAR
jgi:hypothetical protein